VGNRHILITWVQVLASIASQAGEALASLKCHLACGSPPE
jgi:hypothetical protein